MSKHLTHASGIALETALLFLVSLSTNLVQTVSYEMAWHEVLYGRSWSPEDEAY